jgi:hypothetical protein
MTSDESPVQHEVGVPSRAGQHAFDTSRAHHPPQRASVHTTEGFELLLK